MVINRSPAQLNLEFTFEEELRERNQSEDGIVFHDDNLGSKQKIIGPFFTRCRHKGSVVHQLSQSYVDLPKRTKKEHQQNCFIWMNFKTCGKLLQGYCRIQCGIGGS